jgi:hypothetical protein
MFQFPGFAFYPYVFRIKYLLVDNQKSEAIPPKQYDLEVPVIEGGFPHSEICGSTAVRASPQLIAAYHVLHRLLPPRHPPDALMSLDRSH